MMNTQVSNPFEYKVTQLTRELSAIRRMNTLRKWGSTVALSIGGPCLTLGLILLGIGIWADSARLVGVAVACGLITLVMYQLSVHLDARLTDANERYDEAEAELNAVTSI